MKMHLDKVLRNADKAYLCKLAQKLVTITIEEIINSVDALQAWQHMWICTQQQLRARILMQQSGGPMDQQHSNAHAPASPPTHPPIPMTTHPSHQLQSP